MEKTIAIYITLIINYFIFQKLKQFLDKEQDGNRKPWLLKNIQGKQGVV
jgi:hypothetical protein